MLNAAMLVALVLTATPQMAPGEKISAAEYMRHLATRSNEGFDVATDFPKVEIVIPENADYAHTFAEVCKRSGTSVLPMKPSERDTDNPTFGRLTNPAIAADKNVMLVYRGSKRDELSPTYVELSFEVIAPKSFSIAFYDPHLKVIGGSGGRLPLAGEHPVKWKEIKQHARRLPVTVRVRNVDQKATALDYLKLQLYFQQRGKGRPDTEAEFFFKQLRL